QLPSGGFLGLLDLDTRVYPGQHEFAAVGAGSKAPRSVMILGGPAPRSPRRCRSPGPVPFPNEVTKSTVSSRAHRLCRMITMASRHEAAISGARPPGADCVDHSGGKNPCPGTGSGS